MKTICYLVQSSQQMVKSSHLALLALVGLELIERVQLAEVQLQRKRRTFQ